MSAAPTLCSPAHRARLRAGSGRRPPRGPIVPREEPTLLPGQAISPETEDSCAPSDEELLGRYRDTRRPEDFTELVRRFSGELGLYLTRYLGDSVLAEDVLQETFLRVHARCGLYQDGLPARSWLYAVAIPARLMSRGDPDGCGQSATVDRARTSILSSFLEERERQLWVRQSVAQLPESLRHALVLIYYQGLPYAQVAGLLDLPLGTVKSRLHSAIARLRAMADRYERAGRGSDNGPRRLA
jgi:RNA polymerase sigma-70 factor (ECF subfamily)